MRSILLAFAAASFVSVQCFAATPADVGEAIEFVDDPIARIAELRREITKQERALLKVLRNCDTQFDRVQRMPPETRTMDDWDLAARAERTKLRAIETLAVLQSPKGLDYLVTHFLYTPIGPRRTEHGIFYRFPCAYYLAKSAEPTAVRAVVHLVKHTEMTQTEKVFCARFLYHIARNPDRQNALGRNLLLEEIKDLELDVEALGPERGRDLEGRLIRMRRNVHGVLVCYDRILENDDLAMQEFHESKIQILNAAKSKWEGTQQ